MAGAENIDTDLYATQAEAVQAAIDMCEPGERVVICRGNWGSCPSGDMEACEFCARVPWRPGLTAADVLAAAKSN